MGADARAVLDLSPLEGLTRLTPETIRNGTEAYAVESGYLVRASNVNVITKPWGERVITYEYVSPEGAPRRAIRKVDEALLYAVPAPGAKDIAAVVGTAKDRGKLGSLPEGVESKVGQMLTGETGSLPVQLSKLAVKANKPGVKGARRTKRKTRKVRKTRSRRRT